MAAEQKEAAEAAAEAKQLREKEEAAVSAAMAELRASLGEGSERILGDDALRGLVAETRSKQAAVDAKERPMVAACEAGETDTATERLQELLEGGATPSRAALSALLTAHCRAASMPRSSAWHQAMASAGLKRAFKMLQWCATTEQIPSESLPSTEAMLVFLGACGQQRVDRVAVERVEALFVLLHERGFEVTDEIKWAFRAVRETAARQEAKQAEAARLAAQEEAAAAAAAAEEEQQQDDDDEEEEEEEERGMAAAQGELTRPELAVLEAAKARAAQRELEAAEAARARVVTPRRPPSSSGSSSFEQDWSDDE